MTVTNTSLLGLALPTTGTESGVWGDDVNNGLTILIDVSVAGTNNITQDSDITLAVSNGNNSSSFTSTATNSAVAQYYVLNCSGARTALRNIIVPTTSKTYVVTNGTTGGFGITVKKSGGTGVTVAAGETAIVFYNTVTGDVAKVTSTVNVSSFSAGTTGLTPSTATTGAVTLAGTLATTNGGTGLTSFTANGVVYASSTSALATGSALTFDGTNFATTGTVTANGRSKFIGASEPFSIYLRYNSSTNGVYLGSSAADTLNAYDSAGNPFYAFSAASAIFSISGSEQMRLTSTGLGIGTSSPLGRLQVSGSDPSAIFASTNNSGGSYANLLFRHTDGLGTAYNIAAVQGLTTANGGNGALAFYTAASYNSNVERMRLDSNGNLGLGVTPTYWTPSWTALQIGYSGSIAGHASVNIFTLSSNASYEGAPRYIQNGLAAQYQMSSGVHSWYYASSGTAGNGIAFTQAMTLDASGNLLLGTTSGSTNGRLTVYETTNARLFLTDSTLGTTYGGQVRGYGVGGNGGNLSLGSIDANVYNEAIRVLNQATGLVFYTNSGVNGVTTERGRIDSSGNLLVGTTTSIGPLTVDSGSGATGFININSPALTDANQTLGFSIQDGNHGVFLLKDGTGVAINELLFKEYGGVFKWINANTSAVPMTLDSSGNLLVGTTASGGQSGFAVLKGGSGIQTSIEIAHNFGTASGVKYADFLYATGSIGSITQSGTTAVLYNTTSDQRLKENIQDALSASALIDAIQVRQYDWKSDGSHQRYGFVAQELVTVAPEAVHQPVDPDDMMAVDYSKLVPMLVKEIQSLRKRLADAGIA